MVKTLLEIFTEQDTQQKKKRRTVNRQARGKGSRAEGLLIRQLEQHGYEARRTHMSLFPDIIAWKGHELLLIEVKARKASAGAVSGALSLFRSGVRTMTNIPISAKILCYLRMNDTWSAYEWQNGTTGKVESVINEET